jgi:hypothetical protein
MQTDEGFLQAAVDLHGLSGDFRRAVREQEVRRFRLILRRDRGLGQRALGVEFASLLRNDSSSSDSSNAIAYFTSDAITRSRGNMVDPATTVAGRQRIHAHQRRQFHRQAAHQMIRGGLRCIVGERTFFRHHRVHAGGEHQASAQSLARPNGRASSPTR